MLRWPRLARRRRWLALFGRVDHEQRDEAKEVESTNGDRRHRLTFEPEPPGDAKPSNRNAEAEPLAPFAGWFDWLD